MVEKPEPSVLQENSVQRAASLWAREARGPSLYGPRTRPDMEPPNSPYLPVDTALHAYPPGQPGQNTGHRCDQTTLGLVFCPPLALGFDRHLNSISIRVKNSPPTASQGGWRDSTVLKSQLLHSPVTSRSLSILTYDLKGHRLHLGSPSTLTCDLKGHSTHSPVTLSCPEASTLATSPCSSLPREENPFLPELEAHTDAEARPFSP